MSLTACQAGLEKLAHLQVLYMSNNKISSWREVDALSALKTLEEVVLIGNPIYNEYKDKVPDYRMEVTPCSSRMLWLV